MARRSQDIVKKNSKLESFLQRSLTGETFDRVRGYESCICVSDKENKAFKYVVLSDEWIYLTENPPKSIKGVVHLRDVVNVELVNDYPDFLSGDEQNNTQHIAITYLTNEPARRRSLRRSRYRSPRSSVIDLQNGDRSNNSTPLGYASSLDGSEDAGYITQSTSSLPRSRPSSRGSVGSQREGRPNMNKKKKKPPAISENWESDSILRSLKEEIEEDMLEDIEEDSLSIVRASHAASVRGTKSSFENQSPPRSGMNSLNASQTSVRPLPPRPRTGAFETVVSPPKGGLDNTGIVLSPAEANSEKSGCSCLSLFFCIGKSQVAPLDKTTSIPVDAKFQIQSQLISDSKTSIPNVSVSTMNDDEQNNRRASMMGVTTPGARSRSTTPSLDPDKFGSLPSELSGSTSTLHALPLDSNSSEQRQRVLHIYMLSSSSPMIMLVRGAWSNYLIRATLSLDPDQDSLDSSIVLPSSKNQREKCELLFNQLKQQLFDPNNSIEDYSQRFTDLKRATKKNILMKKLFWRSGDILALMVQQLQKYMPQTEANIHTEDGRDQRVEELEFVILLVTTLSLMFRESEILPARMQALKTERGTHVRNLLITLTAALKIPEKQILLMKHWSAPSKSTRFGSTSTLNRDAELQQLFSEYIRVAISAVFELFLMAKQNHYEQGEGIHFSVSWMMKVMEESKHTELFVELVMSQVLEMINLARFGAVSCDQAVLLYQQFFVLLEVLEHSSSALAFLRKHYHEEFKYFIQGPALTRKLPTQFPITSTTIRVVNQVTYRVLGQPTARHH